ncbi:MAG: AmmeMemoRadiSam system protein B [bacterium]|nr:AmmeMemoRadiSam system protein B [bacterium]
MSAMRVAAVAGRFYPEDPAELTAMVDAFVTAGTDARGGVPKAIIVPHAGYPFSGSVAGTAYARILGAQIERVVMFGPAHRWSVAGLALPAATAFATPLGPVSIDAQAAARALQYDFVETIDAAHRSEHAIEVQLPFLLRCLPRPFTLVPFVVGQATPAQVGQVMDALWGGPGTLIVVSSDLSHFHQYDTARFLDAATSAAIESLSPRGVTDGSACGRVAIQALLTAADQHGLAAHTVDQRNSGDTAGGRDEVVGYGAYVFG